jgi:hypothetical protein
VATWNQDPTTGDIVLPLRGGGFLPSNDGPVIQTDAGLATTLIIENKLALMLGEWFLNTLEGTPWLLILGVKNPNLSALEQLLQRIILGTPPVSTVASVTLSLDHKTRHFTYTWSAVLETGETISGGSTPYIVPTGTG